ncbi:hypothetical protein AB1Y20_015202 [Prymnesium parvum]|uniref:Aspartyl/asparaginy/proline hydroxylase domain-containing protein n=1 Tax=Prymnesium parvum TaxID=97485 RepID=A0AB34JZF5_PRYPA
MSRGEGQPHGWRHDEDAAETARSQLLDKLERSPDFRHVAAWIAARRRHGGVVPPLSPFHEAGCPLLFPTLESRPFHDEPLERPPVLAEAVLLLERLAPVVRKELDALRHTTGFQPFRGRSNSRPSAPDGIGHLTHDAGDWSVFYLFAGGVDCSMQQGLCPRTTKLIRGIPHQSNSAFFSILSPGTHICPHCGPGNYRLRLHLGLHVPPGDGCRIRCADQIRTWEENQVLVLDDSFEHEVWNETDLPRVVLCVDIWHPSFSAAEVRLLEKTLQRGDMQVVAQGGSLISRVMRSYSNRSNAPLFDGLK